MNDNDVKIDQLANIWIYYYVACSVQLKVFGALTNIMPLLESMEQIWDMMEALIPQSHYDEINELINIHPSL